MSRTRDRLLDAAVLAAGVGAGLALERLVFRAVSRSSSRSYEPPVLPPAEDVDVESFDGARLAAFSFGDASGPACVFAHGVMNSSLVWHHQISSLLERDDMRLVSYDARHHGRSAAASPGGPPVTMRTLARDLRGVLDIAEVKSCVLVGHSMGGMTVLQLCADFPEELGDRVKGIVIVSSAAEVAGLLGPLRGAAERFAASEPGSRLLPRLFEPRASDLLTIATRFGFGKDPRPDDIRFVADMLARTPGPTFAANVDALRFDVRQALPNIRVPALVVVGTRDLLTPPFLSRSLAAGLPDSRLVELPGAGHMTPLERPAELSALIGDFAAQALRG